MPTMGASSPDSRLVADEPERRWDQARQRVRAIETQIAQRQHDKGQVVAPTRKELRELASKLGAL
jgi:hypothetical protein